MTQHADLTVIESVDDLAQFAAERHLGRDWSGVGAENVDAWVEGDRLDDGCSISGSTECDELTLVLTVDGQDAAVVNLLTLLAWASASGRSAQQRSYASMGDLEADYADAFTEDAENFGGDQ